MLRRHFLALLPAPLIRRFGLGPASPLAALIDPPAEAAELYARALGWARGLSMDDYNVLHGFGEKAGPPTDPRLADLLDQARPALVALRAAASAGSCQWPSVAITDGDYGEGRLDMMNAGVVLAACGTARRSAREGRGRAALDDIFATLTLAHRVGTGGVLWARLLESSYEMIAFRSLGWLMPSLDRPTLDDLATRLEDLPAPGPVAGALGPESFHVLGSIRAKAETLGPTIGADQWSELDCIGDAAVALQQITGGDRARLFAHLDANGPAFAELARRLDLPRASCRAAVEAFGREAMATFPLAASLANYAWMIRDTVDQMVATRALTYAGLALVREGEPAFRAVADPFGAGPFGLERLEWGWRLRSALRDEGQREEIKLEVGEPS